MDTALDTRVGNLIYRGQAILEGLQSEIGQLDAPITTMTSDLLTEVAGEFAAQFFGTRKAKRYGKKAVKDKLSSKVEQNRKMIMVRYQDIFKRWKDDVLNLLQGVSVLTPGLTLPGNSDRLVKRVRQADRYKKIETRVRHITTELEAMRNVGLVYNSSLLRALPKPTQAETSPDASKLLRNLEMALRRFIECELRKAENNWWQRVPLDIRKGAEKKKSRSESMWPWYPPTSTNVVDYLNFYDYRHIILENNNWALVFSRFFKTQSFVEVRLGELEPIRNDIAHSRSITPVTVEKLRMFSTELINCMKLR